MSLDTSINQDVQFVEAIKAHDDDGLNQVWKKYRGLVFQIVSPIVKNPDDAEEVCQDTFLKVWNRIETFQFNDEGTFQSWVATIARNTAIDFIRANKRRIEAAIDFSTIADNGNWDQGMLRAEEKSISYALTDFSSVAESELEAQELEQSLKREIERLVGPKPRTAWTLRHIKGLSPKEIGAEMGIPVGTAKTWVFRANQALQQQDHQAWQTGEWDAHDNRETAVNFLADHCIASTHVKVRYQELYQAYQSWCEANDASPLPQSVLGRRLTESGFERKREMGTPYHWYGIGLEAHPESAIPDHTMVETIERYARPKPKTAWQLRYVTGMRRQQIAVEMGAPLSTVNTWLARARATMQQYGTDATKNVANFLSEKCIVSKNEKVRVKDLYDAYTSWCELKNKQPVLKTAFKIHLVRRGFELKRWCLSGNHCWLGIGLEAQCDAKAPKHTLGETIRQYARPHPKTAWTLRHIEGMRAKKIATEIGVPLKTVQTWLFRANETLKRYNSDTRKGVNNFLVDCCVVSTAAKVRYKDLYEAYQSWGEANDKAGLIKSVFATHLTERGFELRKHYSCGYHYWFGIGLRDTKK